jgi:hypothetical protein
MLSPSTVRIYSPAAMKHLRYVPIAFICGVHGFALFAPYVAVLLTVGSLIRRR